MSRKILFVAMSNSPHAARWIQLIADEGWDLHLFPVYSAQPHSYLRNITIHKPWRELQPFSNWKMLLHDPSSFFSKRLAKNQNNPSQIIIKNIYPFPVVSSLNRALSHLKSAPLGESDVCAPLPYGPHVLARLIKKLKPTLIHSMEFQHAGYNVLRAKELIGSKKFPKWLATNWGSDIYHYRQFNDHHQQITRLLKNLDYYSCECHRDIDIARQMGLVAKTMPVFPNTGGFDIPALSKIRERIAPASRRLIMIKGYQHFAGRALVALEAVKTCVDILLARNYKIIIFSPSIEIFDQVEKMRQQYDLNIETLGYAPHEKMLELFAEARLYLGVSVSDAISTSMLEAMAMGAFPIQTNTSCCEEWIKDSVSGFIIPPDDIAYIGKRIRQALVDDALVTQASNFNWNTVCNRLDQKLLKQKEILFYNEIFSDVEFNKKSKSI